MLGIPADPRLIEVIGWFAYLVPVSLFVYWPQSRRPAPRVSTRLKFGGAIVFALLALGLALFYPAARPDIPAQAALVAGTDDAAKPVGSAQFEAGNGASTSKLIVSLDGKDQSSLPLPMADARAEHHDGVDVSAWSIDKTYRPSDAAASLTLDQVVDLAGGRIPVGFSPARDPGPFAADWSARSSTNIWVAKGVLIDAVARTKTVVTLSGGGLQTPRTLTVSDQDGPASGWRVSIDYRNQAMAGLREAAATGASRLFWAIQLPALLFLIALLLATSGARMMIRLRRPRPDPASVSTTRHGRSASELITKGITNAVR